MVRIRWVGSEWNGADGGTCGRKLMQYTSTMSIVLLGPLVRYSGEWSEIRENVEFLYSPG